MAATESLSAMDAAFLYYERPVQRLHVGSVSLLDGRVPFDDFSTFCVERLAQLPRYRQRPVRPALDWRLPTWEDVPRFDPRHHIRHVGVPAPGGEAEFHALDSGRLAGIVTEEDFLRWATACMGGGRREPRAA